MQTTRLLAAAFIATAVAVVSADTVSAQSASSTAGVTVVRGINSSGVQPPTVTRSRGVSVYRSATPAPTVPEATATEAPPVYIQGGENLWIVDSESGDVSACSLRYDYYGERRVSCSSDRYR